MASRKRERSSEETGPPPPGEEDRKLGEAIPGPGGETRRQAKCKWWHTLRKFGFVILDDTAEEAFVHYTNIKTFPKLMDDGASCKVTLKRNAKGKLTAVDVHVDGCDLVDPDAWQNKKTDYSADPPMFEFKYNSESTLDSKEQIAKAVSDYKRRILAWTSSWQLASQRKKEARTICLSLQEQLVLTLEDSAPDSEEFESVVDQMANVISDQLKKRRSARLLVSDRQAKKHKHLGKSQSSSAASSEELKGVAKMGPVKAIKEILKKLGPMKTTQLSQVYSKLTGRGFKKVTGTSLNHILRENPGMFVQEKLSGRWCSRK